MIDPTQAQIQGQAQTPPAKPDFLPQKFWDQNAQAPRLEDLVRSYLELERRMSQAGNQASGVPASPDEYDIAESHPMCGSDPEVNKLLHAAGFTNDQAQLVYDLAAERVMPAVEGMAAQMQGQRQTDKLQQHFGGPDRWNEAQRQLKAWGTANLPPDVYQALSSSAEGVLALERMMGSKEPGLGMAGTDNGAATSEEDLKRMVADPRYWRQRDPAYMAQVTEAFKRVYGAKGN